MDQLHQKPGIPQVVLLFLLSGPGTDMPQFPGGSDEIKSSCMTRYIEHVCASNFVDHKPAGSSCVTHKFRKFEKN